MQNITIIATGHKESGICNSDELLTIIERIAPDLIFEEVPPHKFEGVYKGTVTDSLETMTIKRYLDEHPIDHFPVDKDINQRIVKGFIIDLRKMHNTFGYRLVQTPCWRSGPHSFHPCLLRNCESILPPNEGRSGTWRVLCVCIRFL